MNTNLAKRFPVKAVTVAVALTVGSIASAEGVADREHEHALDTDSMSWQETKRTASEYWQEFKQDSGQTWSSTKNAFRDGWIEGKLQTAIVLNRHLNPFDIDISVDEDTAHLEGQVETAIQKELATQLAMGVEGIDDVDNKITVAKAEQSEKNADNATNNSKEKVSSSGFERFVNDAMLTADLKTDLIASESISALDINVDVNRSEVTLTGNVSSAAEKDLAEKIVENNPDVSGINNHLKIES